MKGPLQKKRHAFSIRASSTLLLLIPIVNLSVLVTSSQKAVLEVEGMTFPAGVFLFIGTAVLAVIAVLFHNRYKTLFKLLVFVICVSITVYFTVLDTGNYFLQTAVISISLFFFLYLIYREERNEDVRSEYSRSLIQHNIMLIFFIVISTKFSLLNTIWSRYSILIFLILYVIFTFYGERFIRNTVNVKRVVGLLIGSVGVVASYLIFDYLSFLITFLFLVVLLYFPLHDVKFDRFLIELLFESPHKLLISSFLVIILLGSLLLSMPFSSSSGEGISFIDSLFTAASAVCVTGLVVLDTYKDFSIIGQGIILLLIQIGGLGIVTIMTFMSILLGQAIGNGKEFMISEIVGSRRPKLVYDLIKLIILTTLVVEAAGGIILSIAFYITEGDLLLSLWRGFFHAISAFCNAGFALQSDSLVSYSDSYWILLTISGLIIIGGLGFPVMFHFFEILTKRSEYNRTPILVKVSIISTAGLLVAGYLFFLIGEYSASFADLPESYKHLNAFFLSATARTAGFNSIDMSLLSQSSILLLWVLMFIGAGSCSTAGGIKVTTLGVLVATIVSFIKDRSETILFEKTLPPVLVKRAVILFTTSVSLIFLMAILLQISQKLSLSETLFETISAFGTVGLSIGATAKLDDFGKFLITVLMFIGRVNILTFISLFISTRKPSLQYPKESFMIG